MTDPGDGSAPDPPPEDWPSARWRAAGFVIAVLGIVLVAITPNPPETPQHWIQIVGGASLTAFLATYAGWHEVVRLRLRGRGTLLLRWLARRRVAVGVAVVLTAVLAFGVPPAWELARGISSSIVGCSPATQLRMVASPETVTTARQLASAYERWTAVENYDCPTVDIYVYSGAADEIQERIRRGTGWLDETDALREIGPQPDIWLATTSHELAGLTAPTADSTPIAESTPIAFSPVVLAVPDTVADREAKPRGRWAELFRRLTEQDVDIIRADPDSTELGLLSTALLYGLSGQDESASPQQLAAAEVERRVASSLDEGGFPLTDTYGLLCRHRLLGSSAAVVASEQQVARFNLGDPLGESCLSRTDNPGRLVALYPSDTRSLDHQFVRLAWSDPPQQQAAAEFGEWLRTDPGREAIVRTGLRPVGPYAVGGALTAPGIDPRTVSATEPVPAAEWEGTTVAHDLAGRRGRVLFVLDTSGSMSAAGPEGTRSGVAAAAVSAALGRMGPRDEFGLWFFPDAGGTGHVQAVPLGPPDPARLSAAKQALDSVKPAGNTPLFRAMIDGAAALGPDDPARADAVVVLTDGEDTSSGIAADAVSTALAGRGVRLVVVTIDEIRCSDAGLGAITTATAGECLDADLPSLDTALRTATAGLWGGR
ncbi:VWA domain-containing protein [Pseudonocardia sp.]|uniref:vWA domain-containing protein n=1 Tax=Pseudonocardia sp. TaxID=60912 RepID=UPI0031FC2F9F